MNQFPEVSMISINKKLITAVNEPAELFVAGVDDTREGPKVAKICKNFRTDRIYAIAIIMRRRKPEKEKNLKQKIL